MQHDFILLFLRAFIREDRLCKVEVAIAPEPQNVVLEFSGWVFCPPFFPLPKHCPASSSSSSVSGKRSKLKSRSSTITPGMSSQMPPRRVAQDFGEFLGYQESWHWKKKHGPISSAKNRWLHLSDSTKPTMGKTMPTVLWKPFQTMRCGY